MAIDHLTKNHASFTHHFYNFLAFHCQIDTKDSKMEASYLLYL